MKLLLKLQSFKTHLVAILVFSFFSTGAVQAMSRHHANPFHFDDRSFHCVDGHGQQGNYDGYIGECGKYQADPGEVIEDDFLQTRLSGFRLSGGILDGIHLNESELRGVIIWGSSLKNADLRHDQLSHSVFSTANLEGAHFTDSDLKSAIFVNVNLKGADFEQADLRGTQFSQVNFDEAIFTNALFDEKSKLPFDCKTATDKGMIYSGRDLFYCDQASPEQILFRNEFKQKHSNVFGLFRPDTHEIFLYLEDELMIAPTSPAELSQDDQNEVTCAALLSTCLNDPNMLTRKYALPPLPTPVLSWGIEFFHASPTDLDFLGQARIIGFFNLLPNPEKIAWMTRVRPEIESDVIQEWKNLHPEQSPPKVVFRSLLNETESAGLQQDWVDRLSGNVKQFCQMKENRLQCSLRIDYFARADAQEGWSQQWINDLIRKAQLRTATAALRLFPRVRRAFESNFLITVPVHNFNFTAISSFYRR